MGMNMISKGVEKALSCNLFNLKKRSQREISRYANNLIEWKLLHR
jgi:hypothetical protein